MTKVTDDRDSNAINMSFQFPVPAEVSLCKHTDVNWIFVNMNM